MPLIKLDDDISHTNKLLDNSMFLSFFLSQNSLVKVATTAIIIWTKRSQERAYLARLQAERPYKYRLITRLETKKVIIMAFLSRYLSINQS